MADEVVRVRLEKIEEYLRRLQEVRKLSKEEFLSDWRSQDAALRNLQVAIEACLDLGDHIIAESGWRTPETYAQVVEVLCENGVLPADFLPTAIAMSRFRNVLVHEYADVNLELVYEILQKVGEIERFAKHIADFVKGRPS